MKKTGGRKSKVLRLAQPPRFTSHRVLPVDFCGFIRYAELISKAESITGKYEFPSIDYGQSRRAKRFPDNGRAGFFYSECRAL